MLNSVARMWAWLDAFVVAISLWEAGHTRTLHDELRRENELARSPRNSNLTELTSSWAESRGLGVGLNERPYNPMP